MSACSWRRTTRRRRATLAETSLPDFMRILRVPPRRAEDQAPGTQTTGSISAGVPLSGSTTPRTRPAPDQDPPGGRAVPARRPAGGLPCQGVLRLTTIRAPTGSRAVSRSNTRRGFRLVLPGGRAPRAWPSRSGGTSAGFLSGGAAPRGCWEGKLGNAHNVDPKDAKNLRLSPLRGHGLPDRAWWPPVETRGESPTAGPGHGSSSRSRSRLKG